MRARWAGDEYNAIAEDCFLEALIDSAMKDDVPCSQWGPLHGTPIRATDDIRVKGTGSSLGHVDRLFDPAYSDAAIVKALRNEGAVVICKSI